MLEPAPANVRISGAAASRFRRWGALGVAILAFAAAVVCGIRLDRLHREQAAVTPIFFPRVEVLRPALLGFQRLAADFWWLRTIQYFGGRVERQENFPQLYQLVDMTVSLDQAFLDAYLYGGLFLVIAKQYPQAIQIYRKGIAARPENWEIPYDLGRLYFLELKDDEQALHWWKLADGLPGRPHYLPRFVARLYAKTGALETAYELWKSMHDRTNNEWVRKTAAAEMEKILARMRHSPPPAHP
jgi:tetratricopeptide (TPR) repeat protein